MEYYPNETPSGRSPFDLPKSFYYESISDYYLKKAEQLILVKNYDLAVKELTGLFNCALRNDQTLLARELETKLLKAESLLSPRIESRQKLKINFEKFLRDFRPFPNTASDQPVIETFKEIREAINIFKIEAGQTEEYFNLIDRLLTENLGNLSRLKFEDAFSAIKNTLAIILTFDPLKYLLESGKAELSAGKEPFLLFDLDSTLFDNSPRVYKILRDFISEHQESYPEEISKLKKVKREDIVWGIKENLNKFGIIEEKFVNHVISYWFERFFTNEYIVDLPLRGSKEFVKDAEELGIKIIYLTGRFESMKDGTAKNIIEHGFPLDDGLVNLLLKPDPKMPDHTFKHAAMENVKKMGNMLAGFDNEPLNSNIFKEHFPESEVFLLETNHSLNPPNLIEQIHTIPNFSYK
jgi:predicted secreted acid phosphatase